MMISVLDPSLRYALCLAPDASLKITPWAFGLLLWFGLFSGPHLIELLYGVLTYASLVGADYKMTGTSHIALIFVLLGWVGS